MTEFAGILCAWYALCLNPAVGTSPHPIIGDVPICSRCAIKHELHIDYYQPIDPAEESRRARVVKGWHFQSGLTKQQKAAFRAYLRGGDVPEGYEELDRFIR